MSEFFVILCLAASGSITRLSVDVLLNLFAPKAEGETIVVGPHRSWSIPASAPVDPVLRFGMILALNGIIVLILVSALPGELALERTGLAFALLCAGGLIGEISRVRAPQPAPVDGGDASSAHAKPTSRQLAVVLAVVLNLGIAVLSSRQDLIPIVPPKSANASSAGELDAVIVVAQRSAD